MLIPSPADPAATPPHIRISRGAGTGPTRLAAFDAALLQAGVAQYNLLPLSSVIPAGAALEVVPAAEQVPGRHGDLLYCVLAPAYATEPGTEAWAGLAWARDGDGAGLFVEHVAASASELEADLTATLGTMTGNRPEHFGEPEQLTASITCDGPPAAAVVVAGYATLSWSQLGSAATAGVTR